MYLGHEERDATVHKGSKIKRWLYCNLDFYKVPMKFLSSVKVVTVTEWEKPLEGTLKKGITRFCGHKVKSHFSEWCWDLI